MLYNEYITLHIDMTYDGINKSLLCLLYIQDIRLQNIIIVPTTYHSHQL